MKVPGRVAASAPQVREAAEISDEATLAEEIPDQLSNGASARRAAASVQVKAVAPGARSSGSPVLDACLALVEDALRNANGQR